jgi:Bacterial dnaA protein helix-turn-helix
MNSLMIIEHEAIAPVRIPSREVKVAASFTVSMQARFRDMEAQYLNLITRGWNRCDIAFAVGVREFRRDIEMAFRVRKAPEMDVSAKLRSPCRDSELAEIRQQLMAFARVVSFETDVVNSWNGIGRVFHRDHATVVYAVKKYGNALCRVLEKNHAT